MTLQFIKMENLPDDIITKILKYVSLEVRVLYIPYNDGDKSYTIFYRDKTLYRSVCKKWCEYFIKEIFLST